jgi:hypothetical protein
VSSLLVEKLILAAEEQIIGMLFVLIDVGIALFTMTNDVKDTFEHTDFTIRLFATKFHLNYEFCNVFVPTYFSNCNSILSSDENDIFSVNLHLVGLLKFYRLIA